MLSQIISIVKSYMGLSTVSYARIVQFRCCQIIMGRRGTSFFLLNVRGLTMLFFPKWFRVITKIECYQEGADEAV